MVDAALDEGDIIIVDRAVDPYNNCKVVCYIDGEYTVKCVEMGENIFTPFFTTKADGSGIGLAVSRQIIRLHGGTLRLKHNEEGRVTFAVVVE